MNTDLLLYAQLVLTAACLAIGAYQDIVDRLVSNRLVLIQAVIGLVISVTYIALSDDPGEELISYSINVTLGLVLGFGLFYAGFWGGGDSKALMAVALSSAFVIFEPSDPTRLHEIMPAIFAVFSNQIAVTMILPVAFLLWNIVCRLREGSLFDGIEGGLSLKLITLITAIRLPRDALLKWKHWDLAEHRVGGDHVNVATQETDADIEPDRPIKDLDSENSNPKEKTLLTDGTEQGLLLKWCLVGSAMMPTDEDYEKMEQQKMEMITADPDKHKFWVRPQPPGLVFMLAGYILWLFGLNLVIELVAWLL